MKLTDFGEWSQVLATVESRLAGMPHLLSTV